MKVAILKEYLQLVQKLDVKNPTISSIGYLKHIKGQFTAFDLNTKAQIKTDFGNDFFSIEIKQLKAIVDSLNPKSEITITPNTILVDGNVVFQHTQQYSLEEFPERFEQNTDIKTYRFMIQPKLITSCSIFTGKDPLRPLLGCVCYDQENYAATDAHTMVFEKTTPTSDPSMPKVLFDKKVISLFPKTETMWIEYNTFMSTRLDDSIPYQNSNFTFDNGETVVTHYCVDGDYPNYKGVIPNTILKTEDGKLLFPFQAKYSVNKKALVNAITLAITSANQTTMMGIFTFSENKLCVSSEDFDRNTKCDLTIVTGYRTNIIANNTDYTNENVVFTIGYNLKYLLKVVKYIDDVSIKFNVFAPNRATIINEKTLIMPLQIKS